jgi:amino acid permease
MYCNIALAACSDIAKSYVLAEVGRKAFGLPGKVIVEIGIGLAQTLYPCSYVFLTVTQIDSLYRIWTNNSHDDGFHIYWYVGLVLLVILVPMVLVRDISKFNKLHIIGDLAVIAVVLTLTITSVYALSSGTSKGEYIDMTTSNWPITLGMTVTMLEGVGLVLPIKVKFI